MVRSDRRHTIRDKTNPGRPDLLDNLVGLPSSSKLMSGSRGWSGVSLQARRGVLCSCAGNCVRAMGHPLGSSRLFHRRMHPAPESGLAPGMRLKLGSPLEKEGSSALEVRESRDTRSIVNIIAHR